MPPRVLLNRIRCCSTAQRTALPAGTNCMARACALRAGGSHAGATVQPNSTTMMMTRRSCTMSPPQTLSSLPNLPPGFKCCQLSPQGHESAQTSLPPNGAHLRFFSVHLRLPPSRSIGHLTAHHLTQFRASWLRIDLAIVPNGGGAGRDAGSRRRRNICSAVRVGPLSFGAINTPGEESWRELY